MSSGKTTQQMQEAPYGALYIWVNGNISYPKALALHLGRGDLVIVSPTFIESGKWRGKEFTGVVLDHACMLTASQWRMYFEITYRLGGVQDGVDSE